MTMVSTVFRSNRSVLYSILPSIPADTPCAVGLSVKTKARSNLATPLLIGSGTILRRGMSRLVGKPAVLKASITWNSGGGLRDPVRVDGPARGPDGQNRISLTS